MRIFLMFFFMILAACPVQAQGTPDPVITKDIAFAAPADQKLDIYAPADTAQIKKPVLVFFYGGAYTVGNKWQYGFVGEHMAGQGYVTVIPDYRKYPDVKFPEFVEDGAAAVAWVADHIAEYGGDPERIFVAGHSAGAHIGALLASDPKYLGAHNKKRSVIKAFAGLAGPYAFTPTEKKYIDIFGPPTNYDDMRVPNFVDGKQSPMLLLWGTDDNVVGEPNLRDLEAAITSKGGCMKVITYPDVGHVLILKDVSPLGNDMAPVTRDMVDFFESPCGQR